MIVANGQSRGAPLIEAAEVLATPASPDTPAPVLPTLTDEQATAVEAIRHE